MASKCVISCGRIHVLIATCGFLGINIRSLVGMEGEVSCVGELR